MKSKDGFLLGLTKHVQAFFEKQAFGVCTKLGEKMGISTSAIRLFFIYASFITFGSPVIVYMGLAFLMNLRRYRRKQHSPTVWEL